MNERKLIMELRMNFSSFIKLKDAVRMNDLSGEVLEYSIHNDETLGKLGVNGSYSKSDLANNYTFSEEIPFTVMFANSNYEIDDVDCVNLEYDFIEGRGIEIQFDIKIEYTSFDDEREENNTPEESNDVTKGADEIEEFENIDFMGERQEFLEDVKEVDSKVVETPNEEVESPKSLDARTDELVKPEVQNRELEEIKTDEKEIPEIIATNIEELEDFEVESLDQLEEVKDKITENIDKKLFNSLSYKDDNLPSEKSVVSIIKDKRTNIKVCYYQSDRELEELCKDYNLSIDKVYKENRQNQLDKYRRIILK